LESLAAPSAESRAIVEKGVANARNCHSTEFKLSPVVTTLRQKDLRARNQDFEVVTRCHAERRSAANVTVESLALTLGMILIARLHLFLPKNE
jgi:hypothetical protein